MSDVYVDIRVKIPSKELVDPHCNQDFENAFYIAENLVSDIKDLEHYNLVDVDVVNVGKLNPLVLEFSDDCLMEDS